MDIPDGSPADLANKIAGDKRLREVVIEAEKLREQLEKSKVLAESSPRPEEKKTMNTNPEMPQGKATITPMAPPGAGQISEAKYDDWKKALSKHFYTPGIKQLAFVDGKLCETTTTNAASAIPEIWAKEIVRLSDYEAVLRKIVREDQSLRGQPGDTLNLTTLNYFTASKFTEETAPTAITPSISGVPVTLTEGGCYVTITKSVQEDAIPGLIDSINVNSARAIERMIDGDILNCLQNTTSYGALAGTLTEAGKMCATVIAKACGSLRAGTYDPAYLIIHTTQEASLLQDQYFIDAAKYGNRDVIQSGRVYEYLGLTIVPTPLAPVSGGTYTAFLISRDAVVLAGKRDVTVETDYDPTKRTTNIVTSIRYGTAIAHPKGVFTIKTVD